MKISILTPTRSRINNLTRFVESVNATASGQHELELLFYVDEDDWDVRETLPHLQSMCKPFVNLWFMRDPSGDKHQYNRWWNFLWKNCTGEIIMQSGDDLVFKTNNWDVAVANEFAKYSDKMVVVYCNDGSYDSANRATHPFLSREWCSLLGYFIPGIYDGAYNDTHITDLGKKTGRFVHLGDILIDHMHVDFGKSSDDEVYQKQREMARQQDARKLFVDSESKRQEDAQKILDYINKYAALL